MALHDAYARFTPYEVAIPGRDFAERHFPRIADEGVSRGTDLSDPGAFVMLAAAGSALREIRGEEDDPALIRQYGILLFHGFHFWRSGEPLYLLDLGVARFLVESQPELAAWTPDLPSDAAYVQLPRHLFWVHAGEEAPVEPLDGFFWTRSAGDTLSVTAATGMREDRPGLSVVPLPPAPLADAEEWAAAEARAGEGEGADFASRLPGGEYDRLYSVVTAGEILKLAALVLWYLEHFGEDVGEQESAPRRDRTGGAPEAADAPRAEPSGAGKDAPSPPPPPHAGEDAPSPPPPRHAGKDAPSPPPPRHPGGDAPRPPPPHAGEDASPGEGRRAGSDKPLASALPFRRIRLGVAP